MASYTWPPTGAGGGVPIYASFGVFPPGTQIGDLAVAADTGILYEWNGSAWVPIASPGSAFSVGPFGSTPNAAGADITANVLTLEPASATFPGGVSTTTQSFAGNKTFTGTISALNLSGTNTGDVTLGTPNGLSIVGQVLSLALSSTSTVGALSATDWNTFNNKQAALTIGNLTAVGTDGIAVTGGTGSVIGSGTSIAQQVANTTNNGYLSSTDWNTFNSKLTSPMTTAGDLIYENITPTAARLAIGSTGNILTVVGGLPAWAPPATSGTVTSVSVVSANGFAGSVATATSTPAITISTSITGILQGNGTAISAATTTGSGAVVLATSPTLVTPALGTPTAIVLSSGTGLPLTTGVTGILPIANGGTNAATAAAAFNNLNPMTTTGDIIYEASANTAARLAIGSTGNILTVAGGLPVWAPNAALTPVYALVNNPTATITSTFSVVKFGTVVSDTNSAYNTGTGIYVIPNTGAYTISTGLSMLGTYVLGSTASVAINRNGSLIYRSDDSAGGAQGELFPQLNITGLALTATDQITVTVKSVGTAVTLDSGILNYFSISQIH